MTRAGVLLRFQEEKEHREDKPKEFSNTRNNGNDFSRKKSHKRKSYNVPGSNNKKAVIDVGCPKCMELASPKVAEKGICPKCNVQLETIGGVRGVNSLGGIPAYGSGMVQGTS
jgi:ssDNA-binding Zn-finger/Zn-ribbon topoisomerase 1